MAGAQVAISAEPASTTIVTSDILPAVIGGTTKKITAGNFRTQIFAFAAADPLSCGPITATGNSTITGTLSGVTTLTATTGSFTTLSASGTTTLATTTITAATVTSLVTTGYGSFAGSTNPAAGKSVEINHDGSAGRILVYDRTGAAYTALTIGATLVSLSQGGLTTSGPVTVGAGALVISTASSKIIPGATQLSIRNNADTQDNLKISDAGVVTPRSTLVGLAGVQISASVAGSLPAAGPAADNFVIIDTTNNRICFYHSSTRFYAAGTAF